MQLVPRSSQELIPRMAEAFMHVPDSPEARLAWHQTISIPAAAPGVRQAVARRRELAHDWKVQDKTPLDASCAECGYRGKKLRSLRSQSRAARQP
eukprot:scaffold569516_cov26-Prasinocladus_malaysianus.AAC.1